MTDTEIITFGPELEEMRERARQAAMDYYVAIALKDARPATQRAMDTYKAGEAKIVLAGGRSNLLEREALLRSITAQQLAGAVLAEAARCEQIELDRVEVSLTIDRATDQLAILQVLAAKGIALAP